MCEAIAIRGTLLSINTNCNNTLEFDKQVIAGAILKHTMTLAAVLAVLSGCASIVGKSSYPVTISSSPTGARFVIANDGGQEIHAGTTPSTVTLKSSAGFFDGETYSVRFSKDGYRSALSTIDSSISGWYIGNIIFGGLLGLLIVDPATGAMFALPESVSASLVKVIDSKPYGGARNQSYQSVRASVDARQESQVAERHAPTFDTKYDPAAIPAYSSEPRSSSGAVRQPAPERLPAPEPRNPNWK